MNSLTVTNYTRFGLFFTTLATLLFEILLTRIFSVTIYYHFAFMTISMAMFGLAFGAVSVYLKPGRYDSLTAKAELAKNTLLFSITLFLSFVIHILLPLGGSFRSLFPIFLLVTFAVVAIPFMYSGIAICIALTKFPKEVSQLYAIDLAGAALGCLLVIGLLNFFDGPTCILIVSFLACFGAYLFSLDGQSKTIRVTALFGCLIFLILAGANHMLFTQNTPFLHLMWSKGYKENYPLLYEKWNSFSRIKVSPDEDPTRPFGWGLSSKYPKETKTVKELSLDIDSDAATVLTQFDGNFEDVDYLKSDVINLVHFLRRNAGILVIGVGGGRDILSALLFGQREITGVEINHDILNVISGKFGDFTGHLDRYPNVTLVKDEARSYITRSREKFDIIQLSLVDTWAATSAGAFVLSENALYTLEAWDTFLDHLTGNGILSVSRWHSKSRPTETYRLIALSVQALKERGLMQPKNHILAAGVIPSSPDKDPYGIATVLISKTPFSEQDIQTLRDRAVMQNFDFLLTPRDPSSPVLEQILSGDNLDSFFKSFPADITPPTDDKPFFFHTLRFHHFLNPFARKTDSNIVNTAAIDTLFRLLFMVFILSYACLIMPLRRAGKLSGIKGSKAYIVFFMCIGFAFMLIEISQMQRLNIYLGHPIYSLAVTLFSLLLSSGIGSALTHSLQGDSVAQKGSKRLILLILSLAAFGLFTPALLKASIQQMTWIRVAVSAAVIFPIGIFMGMAFPVGIKLADQKYHGLTPWLWAVNGAASVCGSVVAVILAIYWGISAVFWVGFCFYLGALWSFRQAARAS